MRTLPVRLLLASMLMLASLLIHSTASAHFNLNLNVRIVHVEHRADGLQVYLRLPMPYLVANLVGPEDENGIPAAAPFTYNRIKDGQLLHYVDANQLRASSNGLGQLVADGIILSVDGDEITARVDAVRVYPNGLQPDFATLDDARRSFLVPQNNDAFGEPVYVGDATVDVVLDYPNASPVYAYSFSSTLDPGLPDQDETANLLLDYSPGGVKVYRLRGLMQEPVEVTRSVTDAVLTFVGEGIKHILEGLDHVLFVVCLVLGAMRLGPLLWRVTGFTVGHSVTLTLGFFGFVPDAAWFVPAVETGIALSIVYVAVIAMLGDRFRSDSLRSERSVVVVTTLIGLLHGLGFSFVLHNILQVTSPNIWQSLLAFNLGVEIGQLAIVVVVFLLFKALARMGDVAARVGSYTVAGASAMLALYWVLERGHATLQSF